MFKKFGLLHLSSFLCIYRKEKKKRVIFASSTNNVVCLFSKDAEVDLGDFKEVEPFRSESNLESPRQFPSMVGKIKI